ncbi:MAG: acyl-CoA dehydrogenase [Caldilineae bacterium]|nr:MAG: acyl-CoA dehydrogenase [Caldilineae bacterium]
MHDFFTETEEQREIRGMARQFAEREIRPVLAAYEEREETPLDLLKKMAALGFFGVIVPEAYGGAGMDYWAYAALMEELGRYGSIRTAISAQQSLVATPILNFGTEAQKERYLPDLAAGRIFGAYGLTEPEAGSDAGSIQTQAVRDGKEWVITGQKIFITNGSLADLFIIFAQADPAQGHRGITAFLVERAFGVQTTPLKGKLGLRASDTATVFLDGVRVPDANRLGDVGGGFKIALSTLDTGRISVAAAAVGASQACVDLCTRYVQERRQFGRPIGSFQMIQDMLADMAVETEAARLLTYKAIAAKYRGGRFTQESSMAKYYATETANRSAARAIQIHGGYGFFEEYEVARIYRDARVYTLYEGTSQVQKLVIGSHLTGLRAFT